MIAYCLDFEDFLYTENCTIRLEVAQTILNYNFEIKNIQKFLVIVSQVNVLVLFLAHCISVENLQRSLSNSEELWCKLENLIA